MGSSGGGSGVVQAEEVITPAVAKSISQDTESAQTRQATQRARMRGIQSTYNRAMSSSGDQGGKSKLGA